MSSLELSTERLINDLKRIVTDSEELMHATQDAVGEKAQECRQRLREGLESAKRTCRRLETTALESAKVADQTIRDYPYESIGVAFGLGLLIGVLVTKR